MKYLNYYVKLNIHKEDVFSYFIDTLKPSIKTFDYFVNWDKVHSNVDANKIELNILNSLIGSENIKTDFVNLIKRYPEVCKTLPLLLAVRDKKVQLLKDYKEFDLELIEYNFKCDKVNDKQAEKFYLFFKNSGLESLFIDKDIKNLNDYVFGTEVGLDSNGRKNRGGTLMENIVSIYLHRICNDYNSIEMIEQATNKKIKKRWNVSVINDKTNRSYDFALYNNEIKKLFLIETNFFNGGGSKLKAVCGEFKSLSNYLSHQNIDFIWITDGLGWNTTKKPLEETFINNNYIFNLYMIENAILTNIIK